MKRQILSLVLLLTAAALLPGQSIIVTSPREGETFHFGQICPIAWTKSGALPDRVAIRLRRAGSVNSEPAVLEIAGDTANDGSFSWAVPAALAAGSYFVRIKAPGSAAGDSKAFTVAAAGLASQNQPGSPVQPKGLPPGATSQPLAVQKATLDFQMIDVEREIGNGALYALLRNNGDRAYDGPLTFLVFFDSMQLDPITLPVKIGPGQEQRINLTYSLSPLDLAMRGQVQILVNVDGDYKVTETNEINNAVRRLIKKNCPIYIRSMEIEVSPRNSSGPYPLTVRTTLRMEILGQGDLTIKWKVVNHGTKTKTFHFPASGMHVFDLDECDVQESWMTPSSQKMSCPHEYAICPVIYAWVHVPCADGGITTSNRLNTRYERPE